MRIIESTSKPYGEMPGEWEQGLTADYTSTTKKNYKTKSVLNTNLKTSGLSPSE